MSLRQRAAARVALFDGWMERHPLAYATLVVIAACLVLALFVDLPLLVHLQNETWHALKPAFGMIGRLGQVEGYLVAATLLYLVALVAAARLGETPVARWWRWLARHCLLYFAALAVSGAVTQLLKYSIARLRPGQFLDRGAYGLGAPFSGDPWHSFPSGHTQVVFATAAVLALLAPRWAPVVYLLAGLVGFSRLATGWHYLSDVVASAFIAVVSVRLLAQVLLDPARGWPGQSPLAWPRLWRRS
jgi:membrane-associated phospholipid phosphatase